MSNVMVLGDMHNPWPCWPLIADIVRRVNGWKPDYLVQVGDFVDGKAWSRFDKETDAPGPDLEWSMVEDSFEKLDGMLPRSLPKFILTGNHDIRHMAKAVQAQIPSQLVKKLPEALKRPGWTWHTDRSPLVIDGIAYIHGDEVDGSGVTVAHQIGRPTVHGHQHSKAGIWYGDTHDHQTWAMNVGCTWDRESIVARYGSRRATKSFIGWGEVHNRVPHLFPYSIMKKR